MRTVVCTRYVAPLREGGSLPAIVEADDDGMYVMKFRGAGQGPKALVAELLGTRLAQELGLPVPELVFATLPDGVARLEADPEIQSLLKASVGLNLASDYLPGSIAYEPFKSSKLDRTLASRIVVFDALIANVDRTVRNTNMLWWQQKLWLIDQGAAFYFHHQWEQQLSAPLTTFSVVKKHVLLHIADAIPAAVEWLRKTITPHQLARITAEVPDAWLVAEPALPTAHEHRAAYEQAILLRIANLDALIVEAAHARTAGV